MPNPWNSRLAWLAESILYLYIASGGLLLIVTAFFAYNTLCATAP